MEGTRSRFGVFGIRIEGQRPGDEPRNLSRRVEVSKRCAQTGRMVVCLLPVGAQCWITYVSKCGD